MEVVSNKIDRENLKPGDHIYSWSVAYAYSHHGIYVDEGNVIHFTRGEGQEIGTVTGLDHSDGVISSCIDCFLSGGDHLYRYEYGVQRTVFLAKADGGTCTLVSFSSELANSPEQVIHRAIDFLRKGFGDYDVIKNNSEDFALCCKTGLQVIPAVSVGQSYIRGLQEFDYFGGN
ncbi:hypothetical protein RGQ29_024402 [Quercus rubra]|uniref:LRAT domain-containing protein n=1 Tax=Quercus rubra TaxID=3512 RepID=A0AAN7IP76_QUERU|nr:hypothetical protein RGQ29_024402 [Quercus rubra]